ncbi:MAG: 2-amino-4-hydroxy-6-hydroxymethyldihydropteridine diphosphokinase [Bdellovibrionales bacterium]|nr:2-amino-4-hydroxy-6-hydroxymethyldihydropteridine diphosphokinase [Ramlibacter sp.]
MPGRARTPPRRTRATDTSVAGVTAYIGIGANLGDAQASVRNAMKALGRLPQTAVTAKSTLYLSAPLDASGPDYVNAVVEVATQLAPIELLDALQALEQAAGRERPFPNAPRTLDLDLLLYGEVAIESPRLTLPHPRMNDRAFVLVPLADVAPSRVRAAQLRVVAGQVLRRLNSL